MKNPSRLVTSTARVINLISPPDMSVNDQESLLSGVMSQITFDNPDFMLGLRTMFHAKDNEQIVAIEIITGGIRAKFEKS